MWARQTTKDEPYARHESAAALSTFAFPSRWKTDTANVAQSVPLAVYAALSLACLIPAEIHFRPSSRVASGLHRVIYVAGLMLTAVPVERFQ
jgi:hypothetical protein